jgi:hypothetical protein
MKVEQATEKNISDLVKFLREKKKTIPDKDVRPIYGLRYHSGLTVYEYSHLLAVLESQKLLDFEKSVNKDGVFYTTMHKQLNKDISPK